MMAINIFGGSLSNKEKRVYLLKKKPDLIVKNATRNQSRNALGPDRKPGGRNPRIEEDPEISCKNRRHRRNRGRENRNFLFRFLPFSRESGFYAFSGLAFYSLALGGRQVLFTLAELSLLMSGSRTETTCEYPFPDSCSANLFLIRCLLVFANEEVVNGKRTTCVNHNVWNSFH